MMLRQHRPINAPGAPTQPPAVIPGSRNVLRARQVIVRGGAAGTFIYDSAGNLRSADVGTTTVDPVQGITCQQGLSTFNGHGAVLDLLSTSAGVFFQYLDTGTSTQGALITSSGASAPGTDPVTGTAYPAGFQGINPAFGSFTQLLGSAIVFGVGAVFTRNASVSVAGGGGASPPFLETDSPEQTTASHAALRLQGASPDGTVPAQALLVAVAGGAAITPATNALLEVQGNIAVSTIGKGVRIKEGANAKQGAVLLVAGTATVNNTSVTASSRIMLTAQDNLSTGALRISARTAGTSFVITSSNAADSGSVAWVIQEPA